VDAVIRNFAVIGEAVKHVPFNVREMFSGVSWKRMVGMRDKVVHMYFGVGLRILWDTSKIDLPASRILLACLLGEM
jgi:uncharacterized protein with HEPN domain